ncbi:MAG: hypothetical protein QNL62_22160 [Gammaproteobacteria bacterium]|nr:hypothetical protein [Gammaproteobacteria bacterium]
MSEKLFGQIWCLHQSTIEVCHLRISYIENWIRILFVATYADLDGDGIVSAAVLAILKTMFFGPPGPSGLVP